MIIGTLGHPGSGKTYFSERLAKELGYFHLSSDKTRLMMFENPSYKQEEHQVVFRFMDNLALELLKTGVGVIYDANLNKRVHRKKIADIARKAKVKQKIIWIRTDTNTALKRINKRSQIKDPKKKLLYRPISKEVFDNLKNEIEQPTKRETVIHIDGHKIFKEQLKMFKKQL